MEYNLIYQKFYDQNYIKFEKIIKHRFVKSKIKKRKFGIVLNEILDYLDYKYPKKIIISKNENLKSLFKIFNNRSSYFEKDTINEILNNNVKKEFEKIEITQTNKNYSFNDLIKEIAFLNVAQEIRRLLQNDSKFFELFYITNKYDEFEIKDYAETGVEQTKIFIKLNKIAYPDCYKNSVPIKVKNVEKIDSLSKLQLTNIETIKFNISKFSYDEKIFILNVCYTCKSKIPQTEIAKLMVITNSIDDLSIFYETPGDNKFYRKFNEGIQYIAESKRRDFINNIIDKIEYFNLKSFRNELNLIKKNIQ